MALWTDVIDPATLTGYARASLEDYEASKGSLARWLPNQQVADIAVRFVAGQSGLNPVASFRAYDAAPEIGSVSPLKRITLELPAISQTIPISEYQQLRSRNATDDQVLLGIQRATDAAVRAVADAIERLRGVVLETGVATISQSNYQSADNYGRNAGNTVTSASPWSTASVSRLNDLTTWSDLYRATNGEAPGAMLMSTRVFRALAQGTEFQTQLINGGARNATAADVAAIIEGAGLPQIILYDRNVNLAGTTTKVISDNKLLMLPAPVDPNAIDAPLGGTFWGQTLTSTELAWGIEPSEQPGLVVGAWKNDKVPVGAEVISDAIALPVLANANLSLTASVL